MSTSKMRRLNEVQEVAAIREQLQFLKCRLAQPVPAGIVQQIEEAWREAVGGRLVLGSWSLRHQLSQLGWRIGSLDETRLQAVHAVIKTLSRVAVHHQGRFYKLTEFRQQTAQIGKRCALTRWRV